MELLSILGPFLLFIGGFGFGYAVAARGERKRTSNIIGLIDRLPINNPYDDIPFYNEACATCGIPRDLHLNPSDPDKTTPHTNWSDLNKCKNFKRCNPPRAAYGRLGE